MRMSRTGRLALALCLSLGLAQAGFAAPIWTESTDGDLSNAFSAPTPLPALAVGSNTLTGTTVVGDRDYFTIVVPSGAVLSQITLTAFSQPFDLAFLAIQNGSVITESPTAPNVANLLGWVHPGASMLGTNILDDLALGTGAQGFTPPLGPGTYSFWLQQTGSAVIGYGFDFVVVPEPTAAALLALGLLGLLFVGRRR
jgi:hypothetical protein